jgi:signal transduction histidine kinase/HD-like signal output (HDOD) protein
VGDAGGRHADADTIIDAIGAPGLGVAAQEWLRLRGLDDPALDRAVGLLSNDAVLCEPVLAWCRSLGGESGGRVTTVHRAVIMLGVPAVRAAVVAVSGAGALDALAARGGIDREGFWTYACAVASFCESMGDRAGVDAGQASLAGLFANAGLACLAAFDRARFARVIDECESTQKPVGVVLRRAFGVDQHTVGKRLMERWGLPSSVRDGVWHRGQSPDGLPASADRSMAGLVTLGCAWARADHLGWAGEFGPLGDVARAGAAMGFAEDEVAACGRRVLDAVRARARALGVGGSGDPLAWSASSAMRRSAELAARLRDLTRRSERATLVLDALSSFQERAGVDDTPEDVVCAIGASSCGLLGVGKVAVVWQERAGRAWRLSLIDGEGRSERSREVAAPADEAMIRRPADLAGTHAVGLLLACDLGWLARLVEHLREAGTPVFVGIGAEDDGDGASAVVLAPVPRVTHDAAALAPLKGVWAGVLESAVRSADARRLEEELTAVNRALVETREEMASRESMVRLGQMAAGAAHELNNPLTVIRGRAQMIREKASTPRQRDDATAIAEAARQVSDMVTSMHLLAIPPKFKPVACDAMLVLRDAVDRARARVPLEAQKSRVRISADGLTPGMVLDPELVAQALCEPIANAMMARPGGEVQVSAESEAFTDRLKVRVMDRGPGFSGRSLAHAFDPFFSELPAGRRAGLGLARSRALVDVMHGRIEIGNNPGDIGGAFAEIVIPQSEVKGRRAA